MLLPDLLVVALAAAFTPTAVLAVILILFSKRARRNGTAFLAGWYLGLLILGWLIVALFIRLGLFSSLVGTLPLSSGATLLIGALLLALALVQWRGRPGPGTPLTEPAWFASLGGLGAGRSFAIGAALAAILPKMILLTLMAAVIIGRSSPSPRHSIAADLFYATIASIPIAVPVGMVLVRGNRAQASLDRWKTWWLANNNAMTAIVCLLTGLWALARGLAGAA